MAHDQRVLPVEAADGHRFELIDVGPIDRPALVFLPGMGISARNLIPFGKALADHGLRLIIHEWRGNGSSSLRARRGVDWGYDELLDDDLPATLDGARAACGRSPIWLGGHSLGAQLACLAAARSSRTEIDGLLIVAGGSPYWRRFPLPIRYGLLGMLHVLPAIARTFGHYPGRRVGFAGTEARQLMIDWARTGRSGRYAWGRPERDEDIALAALDTPILAVAMEQDWWVPAASTDWLLGKMPNATVTHETITAAESGLRVDHFSWMRAPDATAETVARRMLEPSRR